MVIHNTVYISYLTFKYRVVTYFSKRLGFVDAATFSRYTYDFQCFRFSYPVPIFHTKRCIFHVWQEVKCQWQDTVHCFVLTKHVEPIFLICLIICKYFVIFEWSFISQFQHWVISSPIQVFQPITKLNGIVIQKRF